MVITKNSEVAKIFYELTKEVLTPNVIGEVSCVSFVSGKGYVIKFENSSIRKLVIKDINVDFDAYVNGTVIQAVLSEFDGSETVEVIKNDNGTVIVGGKWEISSVGDGDGISSSRLFDRATITFTPEQYAKLEKDFELTVANYFSNQKNVDTIGFVNDEGAIKLVSVGASLYKIAHKFDATIDDVFAEQTLGHDTRIYLIPRRIYNLTKYFKSNLQIFLTEGNTVMFESDTVAITYDTIGFGTNQYKTNRNLAVDFEDGIEVSTFKDTVVNMVKPILSKLPASEEDYNIEVKAADGKLKINLNNNLTITADTDKTFTLSANAEVVSYICENYPDAKIKEASDSVLLAKSENDYLIFSNNKY